MAGRTVAGISRARRQSLGGGGGATLPELRPQPLLSAPRQHRKAVPGPPAACGTGTCRRRRTPRRPTPDRGSNPRRTPAPASAAPAPAWWRTSRPAARPPLRVGLRRRTSFAAGTTPGRPTPGPASRPRARNAPTWQFPTRPAVPPYCRCTPADLSPFLRDPGSPATSAPPPPPAGRCSAAYRRAPSRTHPARVPLRPAQQPLRAVGLVVPQVLGELPAALAPDPAEQPPHVAAGAPAEVMAAEAGADSRQQALDVFPPPLRHRRFHARLLPGGQSRREHHKRGSATVVLSPYWDR